jgi:predicted protein tyrosine phosphatase
VCISIADPDAPELPLSPKFRDVLRLTFTDIARPSPFRWDILFGPEHAEQIIAFVTKWRAADRVVIHCLAGLSRSPGVAMGLCEVFGWPLGTLEDDHPLWNSWVRSELARVGKEVVARPAGPSTE